MTGGGNLPHVVPTAYSAKLCFDLEKEPKVTRPLPRPSLKVLRYRVIQIHCEPVDFAAWLLYLGVCDGKGITR